MISFDLNMSVVKHFLLQGRMSLRGRGGGGPPPLFLVDFINFTLKNAIFKINFKVSPPLFFRAEGVAPLFFGASYGPVTSSNNYIGKNINLPEYLIFDHTRRVSIQPFFVTVSALILGSNQGQTLFSFQQNCKV